jgi:hypothetical protein
MQFGHLPLALSIATYDWSPETAVFCIAMHWLPNADSLMVKGKLDRPAIRGSIRLERLLKGKNPAAPIPDEELNEPFWVDDGGFHCTVTHSLFFALLVGAVIALFSPHYAILGAIAVAAHFAADIGSTVGLPLLWPLTRKKYSLRLFKDTGWWGKEMFIGYYKQPMSWVLEGGVTVFFVYRLMGIYG